MKHTSYFKLACLTGSLVIFSAFGCSNKFDVDSGGANQADWDIPISEIFQGAPRDGIPAISRPEFIASAQISFMLASDLIVGVKVGNEIRGYPHPILDWHEIVNDKIDSSAFAVTYCPLTGTAIGWSRVVGGKETTFGISGFLFNTNLMPYDRSTASIWSQMKLEAVNGTLRNEVAETFQVIETTWRTWLDLYPNALVLSANTGFDRPYGTFPYLYSDRGDYRTEPFLLFPVSASDSRLEPKDRVVGLQVGTETKVYPIFAFPTDIGVINDIFNGTNVVVVGSKQTNSGKNFGMAFGSAMPDSAILTFTALQNAFPAVMVDNEGSQWDLFGDALSGPRAGQSLPQMNSYIVYWMAWAAFHPGAAIHGR